MRRFFLLAVSVLALTTPTLGRAAVWELDPAHSSAQFAIRHLMVSTVRGEFTKFTGTFMLDDKDLAKSTLEASIDVASINTRITKRDDDLKSPNFFDVAKYPTMTFKSKKVEAAGEGKFRVTGDLTMHGVTKEVVLDVSGSTKAIKDPMGKMRLGGSATTKINRKDFGLTYNKILETGGMLVGEDVDITIDVEMTEKAAATGEAK
ncbi:MAG: YceI family protein [Deltaproteobacteria bacterium]|nr:YceI family protein [Deltaproteobacteria bacterium]